MFGTVLPRLGGHAHCGVRASGCGPSAQAPFRPAPRCLRRTTVVRAVADKQADIKLDIGTEVEEIDPEIRRYLTRRGWHKSWIDVVEERVIKREFTTSPENVEKVVTYLEGLGINVQQICNMASLVPRLLGQDVESQLEPIVQYIQGRGLTGAALREVLEVYPKLLTYEVAPGGKMLQRGKARAKVDVKPVNGQGQKVSVHFWREGAAFQTAPVAPWAPGDS